ncbi:MAG TPA: ATP-binding cassette domain-containing protein [Streptosporangiaceae bacterium]|nr:ATP-binding cassette domain-containing protein [Streptosporangiaceae bacterium]
MPLLGVAATGAGSLGRVPLAVITLTALAAFEAVTALPAAALQLGQARSAADRIGAVADTPDPVRRPDHPFPPPERPVTISLGGAAVRYPGRATHAVRDIDLDLAPGRRVALVGATGAGKSTVAAVLFRLAGLSAGTARLNGRDLAGYDPDDVRAVVTGCAADPHIFDATIRDNLRLAKPDASDADLAAAADRARLLDWIGSLPRGWDHPRSGRPGPDGRDRGARARPGGRARDARPARPGRPGLPAALGRREVRMTDLDEALVRAGRYLRRGVVSADLRTLEKTGGREADSFYRTSAACCWRCSRRPRRVTAATRLPHWMTEARYRGQKVVVCSPDYSDAAKFADEWLSPAPGTDGRPAASRPARRGWEPVRWPGS